jgi:hypothetical protein
VPTKIIEQASTIADTIIVLINVEVGSKHFGKGISY